MVWDKKSPNPAPLTEQDWLILGHEYLKNGLPRLPRVRIDVPLPPTPDGLHTLAHKLAGLAEGLHRAAREGRLTAPRSAIFDAKGQIAQTHLSMRALRDEWETELREAMPGEDELPGNVEPFVKTA